MLMHKAFHSLQRRLDRLFGKGAVVVEVPPKYQTGTRYPRVQCPCCRRRRSVRFIEDGYCRNRVVCLQVRRARLAAQNAQPSWTEVTA